MICKRKGCDTILSRHNPGEFCWTHTLDLTQTQRPAKHVKDRPRMSRDFIENIPGVYVLTQAEVDAWLEGVIEEVGA